MSNIINDFNKLINKDGSKNVCITKPRGFGKTSIGALLVTYYSKGIDSKDIFDNLKVSKGKSSDENERKKEIIQYEEFQGKYHTLYFDFSHGISTYKTLDEYLASIGQKLKNDINKLYPDFKSITDDDGDDTYSILDILEELYEEHKEEFIIIIDEWDYILANDKFTYEQQENYIYFLKYLIKDQAYSAFVYMTGILPIAKVISYSALNCFVEYTILNDNKYYQYYDFTELEVRNLCNKGNTLILENSQLRKIKSGDKMDFNNLKRVIDYVYFKTLIKYEINDEEAIRKENLDYIFLS